MSCCVSCGQSPCRCGHGFTQLHGVAVGRTVVASLVPCVDHIRNIATCLGARPYSVTLVWTRWSGGERGAGIEEVVREEPLLPNPMVSLLGVSRDLQPVGLDDVGSIRVTEVSARFTEDYLLGRCDDGSDIPPDQNFYWEVSHVRVDGMATRRRFFPKSAPTLEATRFQWVVTLLKVSEDRTRSGSVRG